LSLGGLKFLAMGGAPICFVGGHVSSLTEVNHAQAPLFFG